MPLARPPESASASASPLLSSFLWAPAPESQAGAASLQRVSESRRRCQLRNELRLRIFFRGHYEIILSGRVLNGEPLLVVTCSDDMGNDEPDVCPVNPEFHVAPCRQVSVRKMVPTLLPLSPGPHVGEERALVLRHPLFSSVSVCPAGGVQKRKRHYVEEALEEKASCL